MQLLYFSDLENLVTYWIWSTWKTEQNCSISNYIGNTADNTGIVWMTDQLYTIEYFRISNGI